MFDTLLKKNKYDHESCQTANSVESLAKSVTANSYIRSSAPVSTCSTDSIMLLRKTEWERNLERHSSSRRLTNFVINPRT